MKKYSKAKPNNLSESELEERFRQLLIRFASPGNVVPLPEQQYGFHSTRNWRFDFAWPKHKVAVEIQGYGPGHTSYTGMHSDYEKHNQAALLGWRILYFMAPDLQEYNQVQTYSIVRAILGI